MRLTLYEIETTARKASIGTGIPVGLGEEIGTAATWLAARHYNGIEAVLKSIQGGFCKTTMSVADNGAIIFSDAQVAVCGPSVIDLLIGEKTCTSVQLLEADSILLLFGFAGVAASQHCITFQFDFSNGTKVLVFGDNVVEHGEMPASGSPVLISICRDEQRGTITPMPFDGVEVSDVIWRELMALAAKTYVPESTASRTAGAGAGLTDND